MKKICILFLSLFIIILTAIGSGVSAATECATPTEYLRLHIRANSNSAEDQAVKYLVRDEVVDYLTPLVARCESKAEAMRVMQAHLDEISAVSERVLSAKGFSYGARAAIRREEFPTRVYGEYTLEAGIYDGLIVELGSGTGDNWWCCIYPPFCFTGSQNAVYRSAILEIIEKFRKG